jgi:hypothetical protein
MFTRSSRWIHLLTICFALNLDLFTKKLLLRKQGVLFSPLYGMADFKLMWQVADLDTAAELQRSITMMHISKRHIKMRQKLINRFWRFWRACWGISIVEALLIAERVRYWTFSMMPERPGNLKF